MESSTDKAVQTDSSCSAPVAARWMSAMIWRTAGGGLTGPAARARNRYACFDHFGKDEQAYGYATGLGIAESCEEEVVTQLLEIHRRAMEFARRDGRVAMDDYFYAWQNARLVLSLNVSGSCVVLESA